MKTEVSLLVGEFYVLWRISDFLLENQMIYANIAENEPQFATLTKHF